VEQVGDWHAHIVERNLRAHTHTHTHTHTC
jgi:hypothetical protein